jgi:F-type H+-transporting ATPase subunit epsilon
MAACQSNRLSSLNGMRTGDEFDLEIVTPEGVFVRCPASLVELPTAEGRIGVLAGHTRLITILEIGMVTIVSRGRQESFLNGGGFARISPGRVSVLLSVIQTGADVKTLNRLGSAEIEQMIETADLDQATQARSQALERVRQELHGPRLGPASLREPHR